MAAPIQRITQAPTAQISQMENISVGLTTLQGFELTQRAAKMLSSSTLVPKEYQGNMANCCIALNMAARMGADPLMVAQNLVVVHGRPTWTAQFLIATFNSCGRFAYLKYEFCGTPGQDDYGCRAISTELSTGERIEGPVITIALAKKEGWFGRNGSKWQSIPELMLRYRAAAWLVRTVAPEIAMGLQTAEEIHDVYDATPTNSGAYEVVTEIPINADIVNSETGEILDEKTAQAVEVDEGEPNPYIDVRLALEDCHSQSDIARFIEDLEPAAKKDPEIQSLVRERQAIIKAEKEVA